MATAVIIGAAGAIGSAVAVRLRNDNHDVVGVDAVASRGVSTVARLGGSTPSKEAIRILCRIEVSILILCQGTLQTTDILDLSAARSTLQDNFLSSVECVALACAVRRAKPITIVAISSLAGRTGGSEAVYAAAKAATTAFIMSVARSDRFAAHAFVVEPGPLESPMNSSKGPAANKYLARSPLGRLVTPREVANFIVASLPFAEALNGSVIPMDGGIRIS